MILPFVVGAVCLFLTICLWVFSMKLAYKTGVLVGDVRGHMRGFTQGYAAAKKKQEECNSKEIW